MYVYMKHKIRDHADSYNPFYFLSSPVPIKISTAPAAFRSYTFYGSYCVSLSMCTCLRTRYYRFCIQMENLLFFRTRCNFSKNNRWRLFFLLPTYFFFCHYKCSFACINFNFCLFLSSALSIFQCT